MTTTIITDTPTIPETDIIQALNAIPDNSPDGIPDIDFNTIPDIDGEYPITHTHDTQKEATTMAPTNTNTSANTPAITAERLAQLRTAAKVANAETLRIRYAQALEVATSSNPNRQTVLDVLYGSTYDKAVVDNAGTTSTKDAIAPISGYLSYLRKGKHTERADTLNRFLDDLYYTVLSTIAGKDFDLDKRVYKGKASIAGIKDQLEAILCRFGNNGNGDGKMHATSQHARTLQAACAKASADIANGTLELRAMRTTYTTALSKVLWAIVTKASVTMAYNAPAVEDDATKTSKAAKTAKTAKTA